MAAPDYIPADLKSMYELYEAEGNQEFILSLQDQYKPKVAEDAPITERRDPFSSFIATPQQRADTAAYQQRIAAEEEKALQDIEAMSAAQQEQALNKLLTGNPESFYDRIIEAGVIDPALKPSLSKADRNIYDLLNEEETKLFRTIMLNDIDKGLDPFVAQQNAYVRIQEIKKAERVPAGFTTPPVKAGDTTMIDPTFGESGAPTLGEAFGRQTYKTEEQAEQEKLRRQEADAIKSRLYALFANQAVGEFTAQGTSPTPQQIRERADQLESNYVQGELLRNYIRQTKDDYLRATGMTEDEFRNNKEARKEATELAGYLYDDFVFNVYPEYGGQKPEEPSFLKELMTETTDTGALVESRTGQALRGLGGLIRPVTEAVSDVMTYPVIIDPDTGERTTPEGVPSGLFSFQQPMITTAEREAMSYSELMASDIASGRFLGEDYMQMPLLTDALGEENAAILGMVTEIGLPVTPVGMIAPAGKALGTGVSLLGKAGKTRPVTAAINTSAKILEKTKMPTFAKVLRSTPDITDATGQMIKDIAKATEQPVNLVADAYMARKAEKLERELILTPSMMDKGIAEISRQVDELIDAGASAETIGEMERLLERSINFRSNFREGLPVSQLATEAERGLEEFMMAAGASFRPEARAVYNDILTAHKLLNNISNSSAEGLKGLMEASSTSPFFRRVMHETMMDMLVKGDFNAQAALDDYFKSADYMPSQSFAREIAGHLGNRVNLDDIKARITRDYIDDYVFNMLPENYVFISPKAAVSTQVMRKYGDEILAETRRVVDQLDPVVEGNIIKLNLDNAADELLPQMLRDTYGSIARSPFYKQVLNKLKQKGVVEFTQEEFDFLHGAIKETSFANEVGVVRPRRATQEAIARADVPLPRRKDLFRFIRTVTKDITPNIIKDKFNAGTLSYQKASQYGLARILQSTEQEFSNFTIRLQGKVQTALRENNGDVGITMNALLEDAKAQLGFEKSTDLQYYMLKQTMETTGISDDVILNFVLSRIAPDSIDYIGDFNRLYDDFIKEFPSKEPLTAGGKIFRKNTAVTFVKTIAQGEKQAISARIAADMERIYPDLFFRIPEVPTSRGVNLDPAGKAKAYQAEVGAYNQARALDPNAAQELDNAAQAGRNFDINDPTTYAPRPPLSQAARDLREMEKEIRFAAHNLNESISRTIVNSIAPQEINQTALQTQKRYINAMISDLYEGSTEAKAFYLGDLSMEGQGILDANLAREIISEKNIRRVKEALAGVEEEYIKSFSAGLAGDLEEGLPEFLLRQGIPEEDAIYAQAILQAYRDGNFNAISQTTGLRPTAFMHHLEAVGFPRITTKYNFEALRPTIENMSPTRAILASPQDIEMLKQLSEKSIDGTLGQTLDKLSRKSDSLFNYGISSAGYAVVALNQSIKGGMLGGFIAPTGKYLTVNAVTAPFIMSYTAPSVMGATFTKFFKTGTAVVMNPILATLKTAAQAGKFPSSTISALGGGVIGGFAAGPVGAAVGAATGGFGGLTANVLGNYVETLLRSGGTANFAQRFLSVYKPEAGVLKTLDGRIFTQGEMMNMLERNNIMFSQVNFEFGQSAYDTLTRQMGIGATGKNAGRVRQALRWLRPDRPNFWNTIAMETDNAFRTQVFADALYLGYTEKQAAEFARRALLDYSDMSVAEQKYIAQYFLFYSFMRQSFVEVAGAFAKGDPTSMRNIVAAVRFGQEQKKIANTDELFVDNSFKSKAMAAMWTELGTSYDKTMTMHYGPAFPSTESFMQLANVYFSLYDSAFSEYEVEGGLVNSSIETLIVKGNPILQQVLQQGSKKFRSENAPHGVVPVREVVALKSSGLFPIAEKYFELEPIPPEEMTAGRPTYPVDGQDTNIQYRIGSKDGSQNYLKFKILLLGSGLDRGVQDWAASTAEKLELEGARLKRYSDGNLYLEAAGLSTPIAVPNYYVQRDRKIKQIIKEMRAEQD